VLVRNNYFPWGEILRFEGKLLFKDIVEYLFIGLGRLSLGRLLLGRFVTIVENSSRGRVVIVGESLRTTSC
jgi:hypothetical protein